MTTYTVTIFLALTVGIILNGADGLKCYDCSYSKVPIFGESGDKSCNDPFSSLFSGVKTTECDGSCTKSVAKVSDTTTISRGCSSVCVDVGGETAGFHCCKTDLCNSATAGRVSWSLAAVTSIAVLMVHRVLVR